MTRMNFQASLHLVSPYFLLKRLDVCCQRLVKLYIIKMKIISDTTTPSISTPPITTEITKIILLEINTDI
jgi:hypothetical protein